jgi:Heterokaryon incompatibility protein (HET)
LPDDDISCVLSTVSLETKPTYEALSYVWGNEKEVNKVALRGPALLGDIMFKVKPNLFAALKDLRDEKNDRILWVDAICINQKDEAERTKQVGFMGMIYSNTSHLLISLGLADEDSDAAMDFVIKVERKLPRPSWEGYQDDALLVIDGELKNTSNAASLKAFERLCNRPWFSRGWIIQEAPLPVKETIQGGRRSLTLGKKTVVCGKKTVNWRLFSKIKFAVAPKNGLYLSRSVLMKARPELDPPSFQRTYMPIRNLVYEFRDQGITVSHDRIYAFLGIATDLEERERKYLVDYKSSVATIYTRFAEFLLTRDQPRDLPLKLLSVCYRIPEPYVEGIQARLKEEERREFDERRGMPSWVPDWTIKGTKESPHRPVIIFEDILDVGCNFNVTLRTPAPMHAKVSKDKKILTVKGFRVDTVTQIRVRLGVEKVELGQLDFLRKSLTPELVNLFGESFAHRSYIFHY